MPTDGDGLTNFVEMSLGTHPLVLNNERSTVNQGQTLTVNKLEYVGVSISKDPGLFLEYEVETSNDLQTWTISNTVVLEDTLR